MTACSTTVCAFFRKASTKASSSRKLRFRPKVNRLSPAKTPTGGISLMDFWRPSQSERWLRAPKKTEVT